MTESLFVTVNEFVKMSSKVDLLATALSAAQGAMEAAEKKSVNPHFKSKYADINNIIAASKDVMAANGLSVVQSPSADPPLVRITTIILHKSGQWMSGELTLKADADTAQKIGSAVTYGRRYALASMLLMGSEDDDGNLASQHSRPAQYPAQFAGNSNPSTNQVTNSPNLAQKVPINDYVMPFGKHKGKPLSIIGNDDIRASVDFWVSKAQQEGKPLSGLPLQFFEAANAYLGAQPGKPVGLMGLDNDIPF